MSKEQLSDILAELALDPVMFVETMLQVKPENGKENFYKTSCRTQDVLSSQGMA